VVVGVGAATVVVDAVAVNETARVAPAGSPARSYLVRAVVDAHLVVARYAAETLGLIEVNALNAFRVHRVAAAATFVVLRRYCTQHCHQRVGWSRIADHSSSDVRRGRLKVGC
jgi:hypothetical protein